jgi:signal transduction histidine kinase
MSPENGPDLAKMKRMSLVDLRMRAKLRQQPRLFAAFIILDLLIIAGLLMAGYPLLRTVVVVLIFGVPAKFFSRPISPPAHVTEERCAGRRGRPGSMPVLMNVVSHLIVVLVTGGLHSPFLVATIAPLSGVLITTGWSRAAKASVALIVGTTGLMAVLPGHWFGPTLSDPTYLFLTALIVIAAATLHATFFVTMTRALQESRSEIDRAREEVAVQALARARELEQLSAQLSHELKNPLGAIKTLVQLSARDACDDKSRERLEVAEAEVERMNCILKEYLSFSRPIDKLRQEPLAVGALAEEIVLVLGPQAVSAGVELHRQGDAQVEADPRRLKEALFNLVANALQATPRGGSVEIEIAERDGAVRISVRDSGHGMTPEVLERRARPFSPPASRGPGWAWRWRARLSSSTAGRWSTRAPKAGARLRWVRCLCGGTARLLLVDALNSTS